ncbi:MAG: hypothetical protein JOZ70_08340 [Pseudolabrys sp.]|nr:hypothetical protein [Pseudolabrys sp.]MBV9955246.1 hypothetical protein [Pseudolabrys sp.]
MTSNGKLQSSGGLVVGETQQGWDDEEFVVLDAGLDHRVQARLGRELRAIYENVVSDPLPDHIASILHQLDQPPKGS